MLALQLWMQCMIRMTLIVLLLTLTILYLKKGVRPLDLLAFAFLVAEIHLLMQHPSLPTQEALFVFHVALYNQILLSGTRCII